MSAPENDDDPVQTLRDVVAAVKVDDPAAVLRLCNQVLLAADDDRAGTMNKNTKRCYPDPVRAALEKLRAQSLLRNGRYEECAALLLSKLEKEDADDVDDGWWRERRAYALYKQERYQQVVSLVTPTSRKNSGDTSSDSSSAADDEFTLQCLLAQSLYHLADTARATELYQQMLLQSSNSLLSTTQKEDRVQIYTNLVTAHFANATPYCSIDGTDDPTATATLVNDALALLEEYSSSEDDGGGDYPYDLAYSLASWRLLTAAGTAAERRRWRRLLERAVAACRRSLPPPNSSSSPQEQDAAAAVAARELGPLLTNRSVLARALWNHPAAWATATGVGMETDADIDASQLPAAVQSVRRANQRASLLETTAAAVSQDREPPPDARWTPLQRRLFHYNRAVGQLRGGRRDECRRTCLALQKSVSPGGGGHRKGGSAADPLAVRDPRARLWWEARLAVLLAHCDARDEKKEEAAAAAAATAALDGCIEKCRALPAGSSGSSSNVRDQLLAYLLTHRAALGRANGAATAAVDDLELLKHISESMSSSKPAVVATMATLYHNAGNESKAVELLESVDNGDSEQALADFFMALGKYEKAASLYEKKAAVNGDHDDDNVSTKAHWVRALSYTDPEQAAQVWAEIRPDFLDDDEDEVNGAELEAKELPRNLLLKSQSRRLDSLAGASENEKSKNHDAILRRRARKREQYIAEKEAAGALKQPAGQPDPERWIPKHERSTARRRRHHHHPRGGQPAHRGAQGGVSEKDAAKLDVVARQAARAAGEVDSRSTAHMTVSGGGRIKSGKRR